MTSPVQMPDLTGSFLIAMPGMQDPRFEHSVVLLCAHSDRGAMGLIVNKALPGTTMAELLEQLEIGPAPQHIVKSVQFGGPVEIQRGFVLHSGDWKTEDGTMEVEGGFALTATLEVLKELSAGRGPAQAMLALGYAGWGPGQLESEIAQNGWLTAKAEERIVFDLPNRAKWEAALALLGVDPLFLSSTSGRA